MARRIDGWETDKPSPLNKAGDESAPAAHGSAPAVDPSEPLALDERATCDCPDYRRDKVCDHVLMAAAVRMVRRMIEAQKPH